MAFTHDEFDEDDSSTVRLKFTSKSVDVAASYPFLFQLIIRHTSNTAKMKQVRWAHLCLVNTTAYYPADVIIATRHESGTIMMFSLFNSRRGRNICAAVKRVSMLPNYRRSSTKHFVCTVQYTTWNLNNSPFHSSVRLLPPIWGQIEEMRGSSDIPPSPPVTLSRVMAHLSALQ